MTCNSCHTVLSANDKFCSQCGSRAAEGHELAATATSYVSGALASVESAVAEFHDGAALVRSSEWECVARTKPRVGPVPKLVVCTPFRNLLAVALKRRAEYDDFDLEEEIKQLVPGVMVHAFFFDKDRVDVGSWKLVLDPDGKRIKPTEESHNVDFENRNGEWSHWHYSVFYFPDWEYYNSSYSQFALVRGHLGEIRLDIPLHAR